MMTTATTEVTAIPPLGHQEAMRLQAGELERTLRLLRSLDEAQWAAATCCPGWDVRTMYQHVLGACEAGASLREAAGQLYRALAHRRRQGGSLEGALSAVQVRERAGLTPAQLTGRLAAAAPKTVRGRSWIPAPARRLAKIPVDAPVRETWTLGYLTDTIYLRDLWMHRTDAASAVGRPPELTAEHDGRVVADIVAEWARRPGRPFTLTLTGPAGGRYSQRAGDKEAEHLTHDAVEFCRILAGRGPAAGLLATVVPF